jgi:DNA-binding CsgD family transcriptional regulator
VPTTPRPQSPAPGSPGGLALAQLADDVASALASYAQALRQGSAQSLGERAGDGVGAPVRAAATGLARRTPAQASPTPERKLGARQERCLALEQLGTAAGASNAEIAGLLGIKVPNASALTRRLTEMGRLIQVSDESPAHYKRA